MRYKRCGILLVLIVLMGALMVSCKENGEDDSEGTPKSGVEKNYGVSYQADIVNIGEDGNVDSNEFHAEDVVPSKEEVKENLEKLGFTIEETDRVLDSDIVAEQISAVDENAFCMISYGLDLDTAKSAFSIYEKHYSEEQYYILAQNEKFVYCVSDKKTFDAAGFKSLANSGIQYINHEKE